MYIKGGSPHAVVTGGLPGEAAVKPRQGGGAGGVREMGEGGMCLRQERDLNVKGTGKRPF